MVQDAMSGWATGQNGAGLIKPPLVTMVLVNWNYADYIDAAIDSIKSQDYSSLEAIVVDNGSTDTSRDVIAKHINEDPRFCIVHLEKNLGQLGAYFDTFKLIRGEFVTIVDADDVLFPNFVSTHVQVHLALPSSVALTSSNVVEMSAEGRALTGGHGAFGRGVAPASRGLRPRDAALTLSTISAADYLEIARWTSTFAAGGTGWIWGPGTANMYRRSFLALVQQELKGRAYFRAADSYLNPFCHVLGGSALINMRLSAYRIHDANYFTLRETVGDVATGRIEFTQRAHQEYRETMAFLFHRAAFFQLLLQSRFWIMLQQLMVGVPDRSRYYAHPETRKLLVENFAGLAQVFGEGSSLAGLRRILTFKEFRALIREAHSGPIPPRLRLALLLERGKSVCAAIKKCVRSGRNFAARRMLLAKIVALKLRRASTRKRPTLVR